MDRDVFNRWAEKYAATFGLIDPKYGSMFAAWRDIFAGSGYSVAELEAARLEVAGKPPDFPTQHLERVHTSVRGQREQRDLTARLARIGPATPEGDRGECVNCGESGQVVVPHPRCLDRGEWVPKWGRYHTASVVCPCWKGRAVAEAQELRPAGRGGGRPPRQMTLGEYQQLNPGWQVQLEWYEDLQAAVGREARAHAPRTAFDAVIRRLRGRFGLAEGPA